MATNLERMDTMPSPPPDNYAAIVEDAVEKFDPDLVSSMATPHVLYLLYSGVLLDNEQDVLGQTRTASCCFVNLSRSYLLLVTFRFLSEQGSFRTRVGEIERAIIIDETRVEISGSFDTLVLSPSTMYVIAFVVRR